MDPGVKCGELEGSLTSFPGTIGEPEFPESPSMCLVTPSTPPLLCVLVHIPRPSVCRFLSSSPDMYSLIKPDAHWCWLVWLATGLLGSTHPYSSSAGVTGRGGHDVAMPGLYECIGDANPDLHV